MWYLDVLAAVVCFCFSLQVCEQTRFHSYQQIDSL